MSEFSGLNRVGRCAQCEVAIYEEGKTCYPAGHPYSGEYRSIGKPLPICRRVTLILMSGYQCKITMCVACVNHEKFPNVTDLWKRLLRTWQMERSISFKSLTNSPLLTPEQKEIQDKQSKQMVHNVPVGVLCVRKGDQND